MSYVVFARRYRPNDFDEIVGQDFIATTLKNAIQKNRIAHAYLFSGPRGIGKTSTARIFAKSLNCKTGPTAKPCQKCVSCMEISAGSSMDVIEIDGASNRGIDEIRNLRENVKFGAIHGKFKIYIIDEVHMLTQEAFNALLKTLEEPPPHVKFIFATTQAHKVLPTIVSRCQRFDFKRISTKDIMSKLKEIIKNEKLDIVDEALIHIARASEGSLRDAETILDQLSSFCKGKISKADVSEILGSIEEDKIFTITECISKKDTKKALLLVDKLINEGKDLVQFISSLIEHIRNLLVAKGGKDLERLIDLPSQSIEKITEQSKDFSLEDLLYIVYLLINTQEAIKRTDSPRIPLETSLIKLTSQQSIVSLNEILNRVSELEKRLSTEKEETTNLNEEPIYKNTTQSRPTKISRTYEDTSRVKASEETEKIIPEYKNTSETKTKEEIEETNSAVAVMEPEKIDDIWLELLKTMRSKKISVASYLLEGKIDSTDNDIFTITFPKNYKFHKESLEKNENKTLIEDVLKDVLKKDNIRVKFKILDYVKESSMPVARNTSVSSSQEKITEPIIQDAIQIFKGRVVRANRVNQRGKQ